CIYHLMYSFKSRLWLMKNKKFLLSSGRARLLKLIDETGSLTKSAEKMKMSYRHAWGRIQKINKAFGEDVVVSERGGREGGRTVLTETGKKILKIYLEKEKMVEKALNFPSPCLTVDGIILHKNKVVLVRRKNSPFKDCYALPGGFVNYGETVENAVIREASEETGLETKIKNIFGVYSDPGRDPRGHTVTIVYELNVIAGKMKPGSDAKDVKLFSLNNLPELAFDHKKILEDFKKTNF
ncbi:MAG: NUDIX domain-containing protein, partial [Candidatus Thermoplasmatota archaeon]|nr:NUDIX domain-containing protein [Candidatus Thermoplasmatota archaeon]